MTIKTCSKCKESKSVGCFSIKSASKDGLQPACKSCENQAAVIYRQKNADKCKERSSKYQSENKEAISIYQKEYKKANKAKAKEYQKQYYKLNKEKIIKSTNEYRKNNLEHLKQKNKEWASNNTEIRKNNNLIRKTRKNNNGVFKVSKKELKKLYQSSCFYCGSTEMIQIDHIIPISRGGRHSIGNLISACRTCNTSKNNKFLIEWKS